MGRNEPLIQTPQGADLQTCGDVPHVRNRAVTPVLSLGRAIADENDTRTLPDVSPMASQVSCTRYVLSLLLEDAFTGTIVWYIP